MSDLDSRKSEISEEIKNIECNDLEDLVYRSQLPYDKIVENFDEKYFTGSTTGYTLQPRRCENSDINLLLKSLLPKEVKVIITIDDIRLKSNLSTNKRKMYTKKSFFYTILGFTQSYSSLSGDFEGFVQLIPKTFKSERSSKITVSDKVHLKCDCIDGPILDGVRQSISNSFAFTSPPGHKIYKEPRIRFFKNIIKSVLSHSTIYLEDYDHKPVDFNRETISFTCQLIKR